MTKSRFYCDTASCSIFRWITFYLYLSVSFVLHTFISLHNSTPPPIHLSGKCPGPLHAFCYNPSHQYHPSCRHLQPQKQKCSPVCKRHRAAPGGWPTLRLMGVGISSSGPVAERYKAIWQKLYSVTSTATRLQRYAWKPERLTPIPASE